MKPLPAVDFGGGVAGLFDQKQAVGVGFPHTDGIASAERRVAGEEGELAAQDGHGALVLGAEGILVVGRRFHGAHPELHGVGPEVEAVRFLRPHQVHWLLLLVGVALHVKLRHKVIVDGQDARWRVHRVGCSQQAAETHRHGCQHERRQSSRAPT